LRATRTRPRSPPSPPADFPEGDEDAPPAEPDASIEIESSKAAIPDPAKSANEDTVDVAAMTGPGVYLVLGDVGSTFQILANGPTAGPALVGAGSC